MVKIYTSRDNYEGEDKVSTAIRTTGGENPMAPTWPMIMGRKLDQAQIENNEADIAKWSTSKVSGKAIEPLSDEGFTQQYVTLLRDRYQEDPQPFLDLLNKDQITITGYAGAEEFDPRHVAANVLEKIGKKHEIPVERGGEIDARTGRPWIA